MDKVVLSFAGQPGTGKSEAVKHVRDEHGFQPFSPPDVIRDYAKKNDIDLSVREDWARVRGLLAREFGENWMTGMLFECQADKIALDGLSTMRDFNALDRPGHFIIALVCVPPDMGYRRAIERGDEAKDRVTYVDYLKELKEESYSPDPDNMSRQSIVELTPLEYHVDASKPLIEVHTKIDEIVGEILAG
jgi:hypothetical protein